MPALGSPQLSRVPWMSVEVLIITITNIHIHVIIFTVIVIINVIITKNIMMDSFPGFQTPRCTALRPATQGGPSRPGVVMAMGVGVSGGHGGS